MTDTPGHISVMPAEVLDSLNIRPGGIYVDGTLGYGGHARLILERLNDTGKLVAIDRDEAAVAGARQRLKAFSRTCVLVNGSFRQIKEILESQSITGVDGVLLDLGISSVQLNDPQRGFSFQDNGPLDMRMDPRQPKTAADILQSYPEDELADIIFQYGEERYARRIARRIAEERSRGAISTTQQLCDIVLKALPSGRAWQKIHPATRTFQALRIAVNDELAIIRPALEDAIGALKPGGRICVIAFHSLEDRIVKQTFRETAKSGLIHLVNKKPLRPSEEEILANPRARSARLRAAERT